MNLKQMQLALELDFEGRAYKKLAISTRGTHQKPDVIYKKLDIQWWLALCADQHGEAAYLSTFERGMDILISLRQSSAATSKIKLGLAVAFSSTLNRNRESYRRALKKYSNSIVFEDLRISLLVAHDDGKITQQPYEETNTFLRNLK